MAGIAGLDHQSWRLINRNDDQVKVETIRRKKVDRERRNAAARMARKRQSIGRPGTPRKISLEYLQAVQAERDRKAESIKGLRGLSGRASKDTLWLDNLKNASCERIADVWWGRELLSDCGHKVTGRAIAELMTQHSRDYGLSVPSLTTRVHDDLKRIAKFEDNSGGAPIWGPWIYSDRTSGP